MIKEIQQISIIVLILRLCFDTINFFINHVTTKKENGLVIVSREIEETQHVFNESIPYETYYNSVWSIALGFSCTFCFILSWLLLLAKRVLSRKVGTEGAKAKKNYVPSSSKYFNSSKLHNKSCPDANDVSEVNLTKNSDEVYQNLSCQELVPPYNVDHMNPTVYRTQVQNESFLPISTPCMLDTGMFPLSSALNMLNNETPSISSMIQMDCSNSKLLYDVILENRNIGKVGLPIPRSLYTKESRGCKLKFAKEYYDCKSQILVNEERNIKNNNGTTNETSIQHEDNKILEFLSILQNNVKPLPKYISCEKSTSAQFLTYTDSDLEIFEKRLETVEQELKSAEDKMKNCDHRIIITENVLVDLREKIYTLFSKIEEDRTKNVIIVSQVSKEPEKAMIEDENNTVSINDTNDTEVLRLINKPKSDQNVNRREKKKRKLSKHSHESCLNEIDRNFQALLEKVKYKNELKNLHELSNSQTGDDINSDGNEIITTGKNHIRQNSGISLSKIQKRTVALETMFENNCESTISTCSRKKAPHLNVPPHIVPPYKRSSFACTNSRSDLMKIKKRLYPKVKTRII